MATVAGKGYNERLFSGNWRSKIHVSRFSWLRHNLRQLDLNQSRIIELGCFDAKTLQFLPQQPQEYLGLDANWEGGLDEARVALKDCSFVTLVQCETADCIPIPSEPFNVGICMDTLEHVPPDLVEPYMDRLSTVVRGYVFFTVPVELGLIFMLKHGLKRLVRMSDYQFDRMEILNCILGRLDRVQRQEHKGFDYRTFVKQVSKYFDVLKVSGVFPYLPTPSLNFTVGIMAKTKSCAMQGKMS